MHVRGGVPYVIANGATVPLTLQKWEFPMVSNYIWIETGAQSVKVYFSQEDADGDKNYCTLSASCDLKIPAELGAIWTKAISAPSTLKLVIFGVRG